jgi:hypothetical protein
MPAAQINISDIKQALFLLIGWQIPPCGAEMVVINTARDAVRSFLPRWHFECRIVLPSVNIFFIM